MIKHPLCKNECHLGAINCCCYDSLHRLNTRFTSNLHVFKDDIAADVDKLTLKVFMISYMIKIRTLEETLSD